jgi:hypothetical protein
MILCVFHYIVLRRSIMLLKLLCLMYAVVVVEFDLIDTLFNFLCFGHG